MNFDLKPIEASMESYLFNGGQSHFINIYIKLAPLEFNGEIENTELRLEMIDVPFSSFSDLENSTYDFPVNPTNGFIDGSIYLSGQHIPVDVTHIEFKCFIGNIISSRMKGEVVFSAAGLDKPPFPFEWRMDVSFEGSFIPPEIVRAQQSEFLHAEEKMSQVFRMEELSEPCVEDNGFRNVIRFRKKA